MLQAPASGATVNGDIHLVLRAPTLIPVWVRLNGRAVTLPPPLRNGRMELWLSPAEGLRRGGKRARGRARREQPASGPSPVPADEPAAARGADDVIASPGAPVTLDAGAVKDAAGGPLHYRWRLVSGARRLGLPRSGSGRRLVLDPRALGRAVYSLRVTEAGRAALRPCPRRSSS